MVKQRFFLFLLLVAIMLTGCAKSTPTLPPTATPVPTSTQPPATPTPTPQPLALRVNGEEIYLATYQAELARLQQAAAELNLTQTAEEQRQRVLDALVDEALLAQFAAEQGVSISPEDVQKRLGEMAANAGGQEALASWQAAYGYTAQGFEAVLQRVMLAAAGQALVVNQVPETAEQIHARQILLLDEATAQLLKQQLDAGADFATQAYVYDPLAGGDLGWFPRGYLTQPDVEAAAFALQPGETSAVIHTSFGYHILYIIEREAEHRLSPDARRTLQHAALQTWLQERRAGSAIEVLAP